MNWRIASRLSVIVLAVLVVLTVTLFTAHRAGSQPTSNSSGDAANDLYGTDLQNVQAPDFRLKDQSGQLISLTQFAGKPVVLTFMYTRCPDVCPIMAEQLHTVMLDLGADAQRVAVVVISVDPTHDTPASALNFSRLHHMENYWHFLLGKQNELAPVWSAYAVDAQPQTATVSMHTSVLFVIDKHGRERALLDQAFTATQLVDNLKILLREPA